MVVGDGDGGMCGGTVLAVTHPVVYSPVPHSTALTVDDAVRAFFGADMMVV